MRIPDDTEDLVLAFVKPEKKRDLMRMSRAEIDELVMREIRAPSSPGSSKRTMTRVAFPFG